MIYLDANVIIRFVEGDARAREPIRSRLAGHTSFLTSQLSRLECRCHPMRQGNAALLAVYDTFFAGSDLQLVELSAPVIDAATDIRANFNLKTPDAIHLASAIVANATVFLTGDKQLARCDRLRVEIL